VYMGRCGECEYGAEMVKVVAAVLVEVLDHITSIRIPRPCRHSVLGVFGSWHPDTCDMRTLGFDDTFCSQPIFVQMSQAKAYIDPISAARPL